MAIAILYLAFFLSGAAGLAYESVWSRYLGLMVGHDAYAQVLVLVIFLGGMSAGAAWTSRHSASIRHPLVWYAIIEAVVGVLALSFQWEFEIASDFAYGTLFPALSTSPALGPAKWLLAALLILPQSVLLGTTFPLMSAGIIRLRPNLPGQVLAWLYFTNSLGAAAGVLVAGFVLVGIAGLPGTLAAAGAVNLLVAVLVFVVGRPSAAQDVHGPGSEPTTTHDAWGSIRVDPRLLVGIAFGTAVASFIYEIDWIRMLSLVLGSATHSFELMLSAFILGLALGALAISRLDRLRSPLTTLAWVQVVMGVLAVLTLPVYVRSFEWMAVLLSTFARTEPGYTGFSITRYAICLAVMLPATICAGMTLPLITRALMRTGAGESAIGMVYAWNTLGSIVGVSLAALLLLPSLGLKSMLLVAGVLDVALGIAVFAAAGMVKRAAIGLTIASTLIIAIAALVPLDKALITSGVFRRGMTERSFDFTIPYYRDGRTATVAVAEAAQGMKWISTNGKPDASIGPWWQRECSDSTARMQFSGDEITQLLLPLITQGYRPDARTAAVIGFGSGMSSHILLAAPDLEQLTTIEIEPEMVEGSRLFLPANSRVYDDPRSSIVMQDAKAHFATAGTTWDLILSEPSNPWVSGVSGLFTEEFYHRVIAVLADDGVFGQWLHTYELSDELVLAVLAAIDRVFPVWRLHQVGGGDLLVVAGHHSLPPLRVGDLLANTGLQADLCRFSPLSDDDIASTVIAEASLLRPLLSSVSRPNSDFYPVLDLGAERQRFLATSAIGTMALGADWFNLGRALGQSPPVVVHASHELPLVALELSRSSWMRERIARTDHPDDPFATQARQQTGLWDAVSSAAQPPADWRGWLNAHAAAFALHHAGMAGVVDTSFAAQTAISADRLNAPGPVRAVLSFRRAVQEWDVAGALSSAHQIREAGAVGSLIGVDELRDGAIVMALRSGRIQEARGWFGLLTEGSARGPGDLRNLLLASWVNED